MCCGQTKNAKKGEWNQHSAILKRTHTLNHDSRIPHLLATAEYIRNY